MTPQSVIRHKRDGEALSAEEMEAFIEGVVSGAWAPGQIGSMLMAIFQKGLDSSETCQLLQLMLDSGERLDSSGLGKPVADKHSTGGVGDKVSLVLAPLAASCGLAVPMLSGRGLGHTGGTLDKLEAIPGFKVFLTAEEIRAQVKDIGCVIAGQTKDIVPADRILYAMRDETATVENPSLIAASILSKKLAEGLDVLLLDVKHGRGAFFERLEDAEYLAGLMVELGKAAGCKVAAWLTRMDVPLGRCIGNAVEVEESIAILKGEGPDELSALIFEEVAGMLVLAEICPDLDAAMTMVRSRLESGQALEKFRQMVTAQGGDAGIVDNTKLLPQAAHQVDILHEEPDKVWVSDVDAGIIADVVLQTGAGRRRSEDSVDHSTGISSLALPGDQIEPGDVLARLHYSDSEQLEEWIQRIRDSITLSGEPKASIPLITRKLG